MLEAVSMIEHLSHPPAHAGAAGLLGAGRAWRYNSSACRSTRCPTSPTSRCRSTPRPRAIRRWRPSSASRCRSKRRWPACRLDYTRSLSRYGLSQVTVVFEDGTDIYFARQQVAERLQAVRAQLPAGIEPSMGPVATGLARSTCTRSTPSPAPASRRHAVDGDGPATCRTGSCAAAATRAGRGRGQHHRRLRSSSSSARSRALLAYRVSFADVAQALERNNANVGAGYIERFGQQELLRVPGQVLGPQALTISRIVVAMREARRCASATSPRCHRLGAAHRRRHRERPRSRARHGAHAHRREQPRGVARVAAKLDEIRRLPAAGLRAVTTVYDRTWLVEKTLATVQKNLVEGALLVIAVLFLLLGNLRAALLTALVIPLVMLLTITGMVQSGVREPHEPRRARLRAHRRRRRDHRGELPAALRQAARPRPAATLERALRLVFEATREVIRPALFGVLHHHRRLPADLRADRRRRKDVPPDGADRRHGAGRRR